MDLKQTDQDRFELSVSREELSALKSGLNEALEALDDWEFHTRMGVSTEFASTLLRDLAVARNNAERDARWRRVSE